MKHTFKNWAIILVALGACLFVTFKTAEAEAYPGDYSSGHYRIICAEGTEALANAVNTLGSNAGYVPQGGISVTCTGVEHFKCNYCQAIFQKD